MEVDDKNDDCGNLKDVVSHISWQSSLDSMKILLLRISFLTQADALYHRGKRRGLGQRLHR